MGPRSLPSSSLTRWRSILVSSAHRRFPSGFLIFAALRFQDRPLQATAQKDGHSLLGNGKPASVVTLRAELMSCQLFFDDESRNREVESLGK
jgi:hypothetical protein